MAQIQYIKHLWEQENKSLREISKVTGLNFRTVQKYAYQDDFTPQAKPPVRIGERHPVLGPYISIIDQWLEADLKEPRKQRHTVTRIFRRLQSEHGYRGSYGSVKDYVRKRKRLMDTDKSSGFLPLEHPKAHAQVDFGQFKYYDCAGAAQTGHALTISFPYSNAAFTQVFPSENQECLLEGMKCIFQHIGGVPIRIKADNMTTAVAQILENGGRVLSDGYARFMMHYRFEADFCSPCAGNEKGNVENKVGYTRRNFLVPAPTIGDFESFNLELFQWCETDMDRKHYKQGKAICDLWEDEKRELLSLPSQDYTVVRYKTARVDNYGLATLDTNRYSVSSDLAGKAVQLHIYYNKVEMYHDHRLITTHTRCYGKNQDILDWRRHVNLMCRKPGGATHSRFFDQLPKLWREHLKTAERGEKKSALLLLREIVRDGNEGLSDEALALAHECGRTDADSIRQCYYMIAKPEFHPQPVRVSISPLLHYAPNLSAYDALTGGAALG